MTIFDGEMASLAEKRTREDLKGKKEVKKRVEETNKEKVEVHLEEKEQEFRMQRADV